MKWLLSLPLLLLAACEENSVPEKRALLRLEMQRPLMGTLFRVVTHVEDQDHGRKIVEEAFEHAEKFAAAATDYETDSELNLLCKAPIGTPVKLSKDLFDVLKLAQEITKQTNGVFDPTLGPLTHLWRASRKSGRLPDAEELASARARCGIQHLSLFSSSQSASIAIAKMQLDLGGIAKGFAADLIFDHLTSAGLSQSLVAAAGDIRLGDAPPNKDGWGIALRTFKLTPSKPIFLENCAISTSGDLYQNVRIGEQRYSHLIDPRTGLGLTSRRAASVIAPFARLTDPLATAACLLKDPLILLRDQPDISLRVLYEDPTTPPVVSGKFLPKK